MGAGRRSSRGRERYQQEQCARVGAAVGGREEGRSSAGAAGACGSGSRSAVRVSSEAGAVRAGHDWRAAQADSGGRLHVKQSGSSSTGGR